MTPIYLLTSACLASLANFFFRRNLEKGGTSSAFLSLYFFASLCLSFLFNPTLFHVPFSPVMTILGCFAGFLNLMMLTLTAKSFELGPPGLTLTFQNASCIFPGLLLCLLFGSPFGFTLTPWLIVGFILILLGLYLSSRTYGKLRIHRGIQHVASGDVIVSDLQQAQPFARQSTLDSASSKDGDTDNATGHMLNHDEVSSKNHFGRWLICALSVMGLQGLILTLFQWRVLLFHCGKNTHWLIPWSCQEAEDIWFIPAFFLVPTLSQLFLFWKNERRKFSLSETIYGSVSGGLNCVCTVLLLLATKIPGVLKKEMLFPLFTVSVILLCNIWGMKVYKERVNWLGILFCILGVLIGLIQ